MAVNTGFIARGVSALLPESRHVSMAIETQHVGVLILQIETMELVTIHAISPCVSMFTLKPLGISRVMLGAVTCAAVFGGDFLAHCEGGPMTHLTGYALRSIQIIQANINRSVTLEALVWLPLRRPRCLELGIVEGIGMR